MNKKLKEILKRGTTIDVNLLSAEYTKFVRDDGVKLISEVLLSRDICLYQFEVDLDEEVCYSLNYMDGELNELRIIKEQIKREKDNFLGKRFVKLVNRGYVSYFFPDSLYGIDLYDDEQYQE